MKSNIVLNRLLNTLLFCVLLLVSAAINANPSGEKVVKGSAKFERKGKELKVTNSPGARINWREFSIAQDERTHFQQRNNRSSVYNRVVGGKPSNIFGTLSSNGRVYLVNPQGVIFGRNSRVDASGFVASTMDFIVNGNGVYKFNQGPKLSGENAGNIINKGRITANFGGDVWLVGKNVRNEGVIEVDKGKVILAAGNEVKITDSAAPELSVTVEASDNRVVNLGEVKAGGGSIDMFGALLEQQGLLSADSAEINQQGKIRLYSTKKTEVEGQITATNSKGKGGNVKVLSKNTIRLSLNSKIDTSGKTGGGEVLVGGDWQGKNPEVVNAKSATMESGAVIHADALDTGDGGKVVLWSDGITDFKGKITALGGINGGDGGQVETSGKDFLKGGYVLVGSYKGKGGLWLIDPAKLCFANSGTGDCDSGIFGVNIWNQNEIYDFARNNSITLNGRVAPTQPDQATVSFLADDLIEINSLTLPDEFFHYDLEFNVSSNDGVINIKGDIESPISGGSISGTRSYGEEDDPNDKEYRGSDYVGYVYDHQLSGKRISVFKFSANSINIDNGTEIKNAFLDLETNNIDGTPVGQMDISTYVTGWQNIDSSAGPRVIKTKAYVWNETSSSWVRTASYDKTDITTPPYYLSDTLEFSSEDTNNQGSGDTNTQESLSEIQEEQARLDSQLNVNLENTPPEPASLSVETETETELPKELLEELKETFAELKGGESKEQIEKLIQLRKQYKAQVFQAALKILERAKDASDIPACVESGEELCIPDPKDTRALAEKRRSQSQQHQAPANAQIPRIKRKIALVIGVEDYQDEDIPDLGSPGRDTEAIGDELEQRLGYEVRRLRNPSRDEIIAALKEIAETTDPDDSVAIYYAGHGYERGDGSEGYWLPSDAEVDNPEKWIPNDAIAKMLEAIPAKQVLLASDSCYSGALASDDQQVEPAGSFDDLLDRRSIMAMTSGGEEPVSDEGYDGHSIFAWSFLQSINNLDQAKPLSELFDEISDRVTEAYPQTPRYSGIPAANHQPGGDYIFEKRS